MTDILRSIFFACSILGASVASSAMANEAFAFSLDHDPEPRSSFTVFEGSHGVRFQRHLGRRVSIKLNVNAHSRGSLEQSGTSSGSTIRARNAGQQLRYRGASVSIGASMGVQFNFKF